MFKPHKPRSTVEYVDTYYELYRDLFKEVRADESLKYLQLGLISLSDTFIDQSPQACLNLAGDRIIDLNRFFWRMSYDDSPISTNEDS
ncbi:MAG: hypothetical protein AAGE84_16980 [Cyanobacteria bacterium P01_G01_bin.39]